jgi:hypothetical protein
MPKTAKAKTNASIKLVAPKSSATKIVEVVEKVKPKKEAAKTSDLTPLQQKVRKYGSAAISGGLDLVGGVHPKLRVAREAVRAVTGFNERRVMSGGASPGGGPVVRTMNAPVAFARNSIHVSRRTLKQSGDMLHDRITDLVGTVVTSASANTFLLNTGASLGPTVSALFPNFYTEYEDWERWRPIRCIIHYCHFAPTSTQAAVVLAFNEDSNATETAAVAASTSTLLALSASAQGSCYEDFSLDVSPSIWKANRAGGQWLYTDTSAGTDIRLNYAGTIMVATDVHPVAAATALGYLYMELEAEFCGRRTPYAGVGFLSRAARALPGLPATERTAFIEYVTSKVRDDLTKVRQGINTSTKNNLVEEFRKNQKPATPTPPVVQLPSSPPAVASRQLSVASTPQTDPAIALANMGTEELTKLLTSAIALSRATPQ